MGKRKGAGRKPLEETLGETIIELTIRITESQHEYLRLQADSIAGYIRYLITADMLRTPPNRED